MGEFLDFFNLHKGGIVILLIILLVICIMINYLMWMLGYGRFKGENIKPRENLRFLFGEAATRIINDFRHLLALMIVLVFAAALAYALYIGNESIEKIKEALQAVAATLGGLVGSIIGYYFGESSARASNSLNPTPGSSAPTPEAVQPSKKIEVAPLPKIVEGEIETESE